MSAAQEDYLVTLMEKKDFLDDITWDWALSEAIMGDASMLTALLRNPAAMRFSPPPRVLRYLADLLNGTAPTTAKKGKKSPLGGSRARRRMMVDSYIGTPAAAATWVHELPRSGLSRFMRMTYGLNPLNEPQLRQFLAMEAGLASQSSVFEALEHAKQEERESSRILNAMRAYDEELGYIGDY